MKLNTFKSTLLSFWSCFCLNQPFYTCDCVVRANFKWTFSHECLVSAFKPTFSCIWSCGALSRTLPHKTQKSVQNGHEIVRFCNGLGSLRNLRISTHSGTSGWVESESAFKPAFSSLGGWVGLSQPFHVADLKASETRNRRKGWFKHLYVYWALGPQPNHCLSERSV